MIKKLTYPIALFLCLATAFADSFSVSGHLVRKYRTTTMGGGVTTLGYMDGHFQRFVGTIGQTVLLPPANTLTPGVTFNVINESSAGSVVVKYIDASTIASTLPPNSAGNIWFTNVTLFSTSGTGTNGTWSVQGPIVGGAGFGFPNVDVPAGTDPAALTAYDTLTISSTLGTMRLNGYATNSINFEVGTIGNNQIIGTAGITYQKLDLAGQIRNTDIIGTAGIDYSKLDLQSQILNSDIKGTAGILYSKLSLAGQIVDADIKGTAGIAYSKLSLAGAVQNSDIIGTAGIAYSKLSLAGQIVNADVKGTAGIVYSKLSLAGSITNADIIGTAGIARNKIATGTNNALVINTTNGYLGNLAGSTSGQVATWNGSVWTASPPTGDGVTKVFVAYAGNSSGTAGCTSDPCTIMRQKPGGVASVTRAGAGSYKINFSSGTFGGTPFCICEGDPNNSGNQGAYNYQGSNATTGITYMLTAAGAGADGSGYCSCWY